MEICERRVPMMSPAEGRTQLLDEALVENETARSSICNLPIKCSQQVRKELAQDAGGVSSRRVGV